MSENIDIRVSPSLHPDTVKNIEGYDDEIAPVLAPTMTAFSEAYEGLRKVHDCREAAKRNPTWNEAQQVIHTQDMADKVFARIAKTMDSTCASLGKGIAHLEEQLSQPVTSQGAHPVASEIRGHIKALNTGDRMKVIQQAIDEGDHAVATAVLGAPAMLSGLDPAMQKTLLRLYHEHNSPSVSKRLKAFQGAKAMIEQRGGLVFKEMEKAVGMRPDKVKALRDAKNAAEQAFVLKDA